MVEAKSEWEIQQEKVQKVRDMIGEVEDTHPKKEYFGEREGKLDEGEVSRIRFPTNLDVNKLVEVSNTRRIKRGLQLIDAKYPWKLCSYGSEPCFDGDNYHMFVHYAPEVIRILDIVGERCPKSDSPFEGDSEQVKEISNQDIAPFEEIHPYIRRAALASARPRDFIGTLGQVLGTVNRANNPNFLEEKVAELEEKHQKEVRSITDYGDRFGHYEDDEQRGEAVKRLEGELKKNKTKVEKRAAYNQHIRELGRLEGLDLDHVAKAMISLYRQYADSGVNTAFGGSWDSKDVKNLEFGLAGPLYFEIPFDELIGKMRKGAKLGVSPYTYKNLMCAFMNDPRGFEFDDRESFERDLFRFFGQVREITDKPNDYVANSLLANRRERRSLPETIGYDGAKEFAIVSAGHGIDPKNIDTLVNQYSRGYW